MNGLWIVVLLAGGAMAHGAAQDEYELREGEFVRTEQPLPASPVGELQAIRKMLADDEPHDAIRAATRWIKANTRHEQLPYAHMLRGDAHVMAENYYQSLYDYELVLRQYAGSAVFALALDRELEVARLFAHGKNRKLLGMRILDAGDEAEEVLIRIQERAPGSRVAESAGKELADYYYRNGRMPLSAEAYSIFLENYPRSRWAEFAYERQIGASLATFKGPRFDATGLFDAERRIVEYQNRFPGPAEAFGDVEALVRIDESLARKSLVVARWYDKTDKDLSASYMYMRVVTDHPNSAAAQEALQRLRELDPRLAERAAERAPRLRPKGEVSPQEVPDRRPETEPVEPVEVEPPIAEPPDITEPDITPEPTPQ